jgi:creatinine amidohydrolase
MVEKANSNLRWSLGAASSPRAAEMINTARGAIIPVGSFEQHGPHGPLLTDFWIAESLSAEISRRTELLLLPGIAYGHSWLHRGFPGTVWLRPSTLTKVVADVMEGLVSAGFSRLVILNGHGSNIPVLNAAIANGPKELEVCLVNWWSHNRELLASMFTSDERQHAGAEEMSLLMALRPGSVDAGTLADCPFLPFDPSEVTDVRDVSPLGVIGTSTSASKERGQVLLQRLIPSLCGAIDRFLSEKECPQ